MRNWFLTTSTLPRLWSPSNCHTLTLASASSSFSLGDWGGQTLPAKAGVLPAGMGWLESPRDFLRQRPVDGWLAVILGTSLRCQVPVAWLSLAWAEAKVPYLPQPELAGCNSVGPVTHPLVKELPLQESLVEAPVLVIHLSWRC